MKSKIEIANSLTKANFQKENEEKLANELLRKQLRQLMMIEEE